MGDRVEKPWGFEDILEVNERYVVKRIRYYLSSRTSLQHHERKRETITCIWGNLRVECGGRRLIMRPGDSLTIGPGIVHRVMGAGWNGGMAIECSTPELDDIVRHEDDFGRA